MTKKEFEKKHNVLLVPRGSSIMWVLGLFIRNFNFKFWITYRLPFQRKVRISYPGEVQNPMDYPKVLEHELIHARDLAKFGRPILFALLSTLIPLPVLFSGRWYIERWAYLHDILTKRRTIDRSIEILWNHYGWCWPKSLMKKWFTRQVLKDDVDSGKPW